ncbi:MAG: VanZ family protein, partial [Treponema sp.]|nr:VanZ family protein [Treponema sp.]
LLIEISHLLFYQRSTDIDDLLLNSSGVLIGAIIYFGIKKIIQIIKR